MEELYKALFEAGDYTKSFDEFVEQYGDAEKSEKLYRGLNQAGDYTKSFDEFKSQYGFVEKKNPIVTDSNGQTEVTESTTQTEEIPGSSDGLEVNEVIEEPLVEKTTEEGVISGEELIQSEELEKFIPEAEKNFNLLNSIGYLEANPSEGGIKTLKADRDVLTDFDKKALDNVEREYFIMEDGERVLKKESELNSNVLDAIKTYESANQTIKPDEYEEVVLEEEDYQNPNNIEIDVLSKNNIDVNDFLKWEKKTTRKENSAYRFFKNLITSEEEEKYETEKRNYEKIQSYKASKLNKVTKELEKLQSSLKLTTNLEEIKEIKEDERALINEFVSLTKDMSSAINSFPVYKEYNKDEDLKQRKRLYEAAQEGGSKEFTEGSKELLKTGFSALSNFSTEFFGGIPAIIDQRLTNLGFEEKGVLAGLSEMITDTSDRVDLIYGPTKRSGFTSGKPVFYKGKKFYVDENGTVIDDNTNVNMEGIISPSDIKEIQERSKNVKETEFAFTGGSVASGGVSTLVHLFGLIRTGKATNKALGLGKYMKAGTAGKVGMGLTSFTSSVVNNVEDIRSQLMASGMSEKESMDVAVNAGQAISTLDGIFSGLAGSNEKLLTGFQGIKEQIKNLAISKGKNFTKKQLVEKGTSLFKENLKELAVEELPVLFATKGINYLVNKNIGKEVLNSNVTSAEVLETAVMTIGATTTLGSRNLLKGNKRADLVRTVAKDIDNLQGTLDLLVKEGSLTKQQAFDAYTEIYGMQNAENKTKGTIVLSENLEPASDLLQQRQDLVSQKEGLEGPLKKNIDDKIADVDAQLDALYNKDKEQAKAIVDNPKTEKDAIQEPSTEKQMLQDDAGSKEEGRDSELGLQQVGEGDVGQVSTETEVETSKTETDKTSDTTTQGDTEQVDMSVNKGRVDSIVDGIIEKTKGRNTGESTNPNKVANNAIEYLKGSKLFEQSNDVERETILRDVSKRLGIEIKPPTAKKLLGIKRIGKPTTIKVKSDYAELKKDLRKEQKIARDAKNDVNKRRKGLQGSIDAVLKAGNITTKKANTLLKKVSNVNLYNAQKVQDVIDFTERAMNDAEYSNKLEKANKLQKAIKTTLKGKEAGLSDTAKEFAKVNPSNVSDIDGYLEKAESVRKGLQPTRKPSKGDLKVTKPFDIKKITEYSKKEVNTETERNYQLAKESFQELTGLDAGELTLEDMRDMIANSSVEEDIEYDNKSKEIDKAVVNAFKNTKINIKGAIERGEISLTKSQKELINNFLNIDLSLLSTKAKMRALDSIINFELNQSTGGMESALEQYKGNKETTALLNKDIKANEKSSFIGGRWNKYISTLPNAFELIFKSQQKAQMFMKAIGVEGVINGSAKAEKEGSVVEEKYAKDFGKKKMKDGIYFDESNDTQRAILADIRRFTPGTEAEQQKEFEDSKNLVKETYEELLQSSDKIRKRKGEIIKEQYEKILKDSKTISDVESKVDPVNLEGVKYVTENIWAKKYDELSEVSLNVYNKNLGKDINYTPRNYQKLDDKVETPDITKPVFNPDGLSRKNAYDKKTGVLKEAKKLSSLPKGRVLNLSFDSQNMRNYKAALTDIYTASSIQKIKGARDSKAFNKILPNPEARQVINDRINNYVDAKRGNTYLDKQNKRFLRRLNKFSTLGVRAVLGGPTQVLKQLVPLSNTAVNAGPVNTAIGTKLIFNKEVKEAINNSGLPIANRGIKSQSDIDGLDSKISKKAKTKLGNALDFVDNINKQTIELFLVSPDVAAARASFIAYYIKDIQKQGKKVGDIDWTKPLDKKAAQYAQQQVDRQQNASDQDLQGDLFTNQNAKVQILRKTVFPFANFLLNQKTRMYSDINTLVRNPTALPGDKTRAAKSLGGLAVETVTFNAIGLAVTQLLSGIAGSFSGEDEDPNLSTFDNYMKNEEEKDKQFKNRVRGRSGNMLADIISPIPILNDYMLSKANILLGLMQEGDDDPFKFFAKTDKKLVEQLGVLGIGGKKIDILKDMILAASTGEVSSEYMGKKSVKKITDKSRDKMKQVAAMYALHLLGVPFLNFSEVGYMSERAFKNLSKMKERELKYDIESDAVDRLKKRGISRPSEESIKNEMRNIRRENKGVNKKSSNKTFKPKSFGSGKSKSKSFNPKSF